MIFPLLVQRIIMCCVGNTPYDDYSFSAAMNQPDVQSMAALACTSKQWRLIWNMVQMHELLDLARVYFIGESLVWPTLGSDGCHFRAALKPGFYSPSIEECEQVIRTRIKPRPGKPTHVLCGQYRIPYANKVRSLVKYTSDQLCTIPRVPIELFSPDLKKLTVKQVFEQPRLVALFDTALRNTLAVAGELVLKQTLQNIFLRLFCNQAKETHRASTLKVISPHGIVAASNAIIATVLRRPDLWLWRIESDRPTLAFQEIRQHMLSDEPKYYETLDYLKLYRKLRYRSIGEIYSQASERSKETSLPRPSNLFKVLKKIDETFCSPPDLETRCDDAADRRMVITLPGNDIVPALCITHYTSRPNTYMCSVNTATNAHRRLVDPTWYNGHDCLESFRLERERSLASVVLRDMTDVPSMFLKEQMEYTAFVLFKSSPYKLNGVKKDAFDVRIDVLDPKNTERDDIRAILDVTSKFGLLSAEKLHAPSDHRLYKYLETEASEDDIHVYKICSQCKNMEYDPHSAENDSSSSSSSSDSRECVSDSETCPGPARAPLPVRHVRRIRKIVQSMPSPTRRRVSGPDDDTQEARENFYQRAALFDMDLEHTSTADDN